MPTKQAENSEDSPAISFLGSNLKNIVILVNEPEAVYLKDDDLALLTGILSACKLSLADTAIINVFRTSTDYKVLTDDLRPSVILFFGTDLRKLGMPMLFPDFQLQSYNSQKLLAAPSLSEISADIPLKKQLWGILKQIFSS